VTTPATAPFLWRDGERVVRFGRGTVAEAPELVGGPYALLTTPRALAQAPALGAAAEATHEVGPGMVDRLAEELRGAVREDTLVALGGGRVIDTAKALAAVDPPRRVVAVPTTLSAAEMTAIHRLPPGAPADTPRVRPAVVINDPDLSASQPRAGLLASAMNSLGHAVEAPLTPRRSPVSTLAAHEAARLIALALSARRGRASAKDAQPEEGSWEPDRDALALASLLSGYAIDAAGYGLHHVMSQTLVRGAGVGHGPANAAMLPRTLVALRRRFPEEIDRLGRAMGDDPDRLAARVGREAGAGRIRDLGVARERLPELVRMAAARPDLAMTPPVPADAELLDLYEAAW
jgi:alcohol dehydrogenase class IV